jgi:peptidoglycan/LPS O-acetylase OafA/YrhL
MGAARGPRLYFVQWLRVWLIISVVAHHSAEAYVPGPGGWPFKDPSTTPFLSPMMGLNAAYFMGFFFLISGYFLSGSYDRKGGWAFVKSRLVRLGIPLVVMVVFLFGFESYASSGVETGFWSYLLTVYLGQLQLEFGHLWFIAHLLFYALVYAAWRALRSKPATGGLLSAPGHLAILVYVLALAVVGALVRQAYPQNTWVNFLWIIPVEPAHLPQYLSLFTLGVIAGRGEWFAKIDNKVALVWFAIGVLAFASYVFDLVPSVIIRTIGGEAVWGIQEAFICVGMILGLLAFFRDNFSAPSKWAIRLAGNAYGVYIIHIFAVMGLQELLSRVDLHPLMKFPVVLACSLVITFILVDLLRRIPGVGRVI